MLSIGPHVSKSTDRKDVKKKHRKMDKALAEDLEFVESFDVKTPSAQIFVTGPMNFKETLSDDEKKNIAAYVSRNGTSLVIHGAYLDNGCWNLSNGSIHNIKQELRIAEKLGATGVIIHLGAGAINNQNARKVIEEIGNIEKHVRDNTILWLEINSAKGSGFTFEMPKKIHALFTRLRLFNKNKLQLGLCIDTAHIFACGYSLDTNIAAKTWIDELEHLLPNIPIMIHLNDSASILGSGKDIHEALCEGNIWKEFHPEKGNLPIEKSGLVYILNWAQENQYNIILERDDSDLWHDLSLLRKIGFTF
jgi:endonuclease IV